jgi:hypothetical protein
MKKVLYIFILLVVSVLLNACVGVKSYQKAYLTDSEMELSAPEMEKNELTFQVYREGASGASSGKTGGGCGCN